MLRTSPTARVLTGLVAGLTGGVLVSSLHNSTLLGIVGWIAPIGTLWVNALRMTVIPLVVAGIVMGAASARDAGSIGRLGARAIVLFLVLLTTAALFTAVAAPALLSLLTIHADASAALRGTASGAAATAPNVTAPNVTAAAVQGFPDLRQWLIDLVPVNPVKAATEGAVLPLIIFSLAFGLALSRIMSPGRDTVVGFFSGLFEAMLTLVRWILRLAPIGVFALSLPLATKLGVAAAGAVLYYIAITSVLCVIVIALLYPVAATLGRVSIHSFARAAAPAQAVAFSARSSLAALPAMIDAGAKELDFDQEITAFFLPLSASTFRLGAAVGIPTGVLFVAALYGVSLSSAQILTVAVTAILLTFSVPGVPGGSIVIMVPILLAAGLPPEAAGILLGVDTIPDMFRTTTNVTGTMAAATILRGRK